MRTDFFCSECENRRSDSVDPKRLSRRRLAPIDVGHCRGVDNDLGARGKNAAGEAGLVGQIDVCVFRWPLETLGSPTEAGNLVTTPEKQRYQSASDQSVAARDEDMHLN